MKAYFKGSNGIDHVDGVRWKKRGNLSFYSSDGQRYDLHDGRRTDGASARFLGGHLNLLPTAIQNSPPSWFHDLHYSSGHAYLDGVPHKIITRKKADYLFWEGLYCQTVAGRSKTSFAYWRWRNVCFIAWLGVRIGGWCIWNKYRMKEVRTAIYLRHD